MATLISCNVPVYVYLYVALNNKDCYSKVKKQNVFLSYAF